MIYLERARCTWCSFCSRSWRFYSVCTTNTKIKLYAKFYRKVNMDKWRYQEFDLWSRIAPKCKTSHPQLEPTQNLWVSLLYCYQPSTVCKECMCALLTDRNQKNYQRVLILCWPTHLSAIYPFQTDLTQHSHSKINMPSVLHQQLHRQCCHQSAQLFTAKSLCSKRIWGLGWRRRGSITWSVKGSKCLGLCCYGCWGVALEISQADSLTDPFIDQLMHAVYLCIYIAGWTNI